MAATATERGLFVAGEWIETGDWIDVRSPYSGEVVGRVVLPVAFPGILTGTILALSRAIGETAPLILVGAATGYFSIGDQGFAESLRGTFTALPMIVFDWSRQPRADFRELAAAEQGGGHERRGAQSHADDGSGQQTWPGQGDDDPPEDACR